MLTALLIMLREGFEAALVVAIVYAYILRIGRRDLAGAMWQSVLGAAALSVVMGVGIHLTVENLEGRARLLAFAAVSLFAVCVLTWMIFWMRRQSYRIKGDLQRSIDQAVAHGGNVRFAIMAVAFLAVAREGLEAALFLIAAATAEQGVQVMVGGLVGLAVAATLGWLVVLGGRRLPMRQFFTVTGLILLVFAAGLVSRTVLYLQSAGELGSVWNNVYDLTGYSWLTVGTESGRFLGAMLGWDPRPSVEQVLAYLGFLGGVGWLFLRPRPGGGPSGPPPSLREVQSVGRRPPTARSGPEPDSTTLALATPTCRGRRSPSAERSGARLSDPVGRAGSMSAGATGECWRRGLGSGRRCRWGSPSAGRWTGWLGCIRSACSGMRSWRLRWRARCSLRCRWRRRGRGWR